MLHGLTWKMFREAAQPWFSSSGTHKKKSREKTKNLPDFWTPSISDLYPVPKTGHLQSVGTAIREDLFVQTFSTSLVTTSGTVIAELVGEQANMTNIFLSEEAKLCSDGLRRWSRLVPPSSPLPPLPGFAAVCCTATRDILNSVWCASCLGESQ